MRLSEMNTVQLAAALCDMAPHIEAIGSDEAIAELLKTIDNRTEQGNGLQKLSAMIGMLLPAMLDKQKAHTFAILSVLTGKSVQEIEKQNGFQTLRDVKSVFDKDLFEFFKPST